MSAYSLRGMVQETQLHVHAMVELADILSRDDSWVPDEEHMLLDSTRETVEQYNLWSSDDAESSLECADFPSTFIYLARLRESTNMLTTQACSDLVDQCGVREVCMFCPVMCQCNTSTRECMTVTVAGQLATSPSTLKLMQWRALWQVCHAG